MIDLEEVEDEEFLETVVPVSIDSELPCWSTRMGNPAIKILENKGESVIPTHVDR